MKTLTGFLLIAFTLGGFLGGYIAGGGLEAMVADRAQSPGARPVKLENVADAGRPQSELASPSEGADRGSNERRRQPEATGPGAGTASSEALFSQPLLAHHRTQFALGWSSVRADEPSMEDGLTGVAEFKERTLALSLQLGRGAATARDEEERLAQALIFHDGAALLDAASQGLWVPDEEYFASRDFETLTGARGGGVTLTGEGYIEQATHALSEGMTLTFGAGVHQLDAGMLRGKDRKSIPSDVTIVGAGRDATLLQMGNIGAFDNIERLTFKGITLDALNDGLFDHRRGSMTLAFENARIVRFDAGHGGCSIFSSRGGSIVKATNLDVIGGYGNTPGSGELLRADPFVGRFRNCRFELVELQGIERLSAGRVIFEGCAFALRGDDPQAGTMSARVGFASCTYRRIEGDIASLSKSIGDLFPGAK